MIYIDDLMFNVDSKETLDKELKLLCIKREWQSIFHSLYNCGLAFR